MISRRTSSPRSTGREVEVAARVVRLGRRLAALAALEEKEFGLGPGAHREAALVGQRDHALERRSRTAGERRAVGVGDVADDAGHALRACVGPGEDLKGVQVGLEVHVGLFNPHEPLDRRAVEHDAAVERFGELAIGDLDVLDRAEDVDELQPHELDLLALDPLENPRATVVFGHGVIMPSGTDLDRGTPSMSEGEGRRHAITGGLEASGCRIRPRSAGRVRS